jgi:hypothetical protein
MTHGISAMERNKTMTKEPTFCNKCGEKLLVTRKIAEFDIYTGEQVLASKTFRCPRYLVFMPKRHFSKTLSMRSAKVI